MAQYIRHLSKRISRALNQDGGPEIFLNCQLMLKSKMMAQIGQLSIKIGTASLNGLPAPLHITFIRRGHASNDAQKTGLTCTIGTLHLECFSGAQLEAQIFEKTDLSPKTAQITGMQQRYRLGHGQGINGCRMG